MRSNALPPAVHAAVRALAVLLLGAAVATCRDLPTGPGGRYAAKLAVYPVFPQSFSLEGTSLVIDTVRLKLRRADGNVALDTAVFFPPTRDTLVIEPTLPLDAPAEQFTAQMQLQAGATTLFQGTRTVTASSAGAATPPVAIPTPYIGPGAGVVRIDATPGDSALAQGDTLPLRVDAFDAQDRPVADRLLVFTTSDSTRATVSPLGVVRGRASGTVTIRVRTPDNKRDSVRLRITPTPTRTELSAGDAQAIPAGSASSPLRVRVLDQAGTPVEGVTVTWSLRDGGGSVSGASLTDAQGIASATYTAGHFRGPFHIVAKSPRLADSVTFGGTIRAAAPSRVEAVRGNSQSGVVGELLGDSLVARVFDAFGNPVDAATVRFRPSAGVASDSVRATDDSGRAGVRWTLGTVPGSASLAVTVDTLSLTFVATALVGPLDSLRFAGSRTLSFAALTDTARLVVSTKDRFGNPVPATSLSWVSTDTTVARVDVAGLVRSHGNGSAKVIALGGGKADTATVTVAQVATTVTVAPSNPQLNVGGTMQMTAVATDARSVTIANPQVAWSVATTSIATVDAAGLVTARDTGSTSIRATVNAAVGTTSLRVMPAVMAAACGSAGGTTHGAGTRIVGERWTREGSPHRLTGAVHFSGVPLIIDAGAVVCADPLSVLAVTDGGKLLAEGTATQPIAFRAADSAQGWGGIVLYDPDSSVVTHALIEHAGYTYNDGNGMPVSDGSALDVVSTAGRVRVADVTIRRAFRRAISADAYFSSPPATETALLQARALPGAEALARGEERDRVHAARREAARQRQEALRAALREGSRPAGKPATLARGGTPVASPVKGGKLRPSSDAKARKPVIALQRSDRRLLDRVAAVRALGERFRSGKGGFRGGKSFRGAKAIRGAVSPQARVVPVQLAPMNLLDDDMRVRLVRVRVDTTVTGTSGGYAAVNLYGPVAFDSSHVAGASHTGLYFYGDSVTLRDDTITRSGEAGIVSEYGTSLTGRSGNVVSTQNGSYPFYGEGQALARLVRSASDLDRFRGNARDTIAFREVNLYHGDTLVLHKGMPYAVEYDVYASGAAKLELRPGVRVALGEWSDIDVYGGAAFHAAGTPTDSIVLTARDPSRPWYGLQVGGGATGRLSVARLEHLRYAFDLYGFAATPFEVDSVLVRRAHDGGGYVYGNARISRTLVDTVALAPEDTYWDYAVLYAGDSAELRDVTVRGAPEVAFEVDDPRTRFNGLRIEGWGRREPTAGVNAFEFYGDSLLPGSTPPRVTGTGTGPQVEMALRPFRQLFPTAGHLDSLRSGIPGRDTVALYEGWTPIRDDYLLPAYAATPESPLNVVLYGVSVRGPGAVLRVAPGTKLHGDYAVVVADSGGRVSIEGTAANPVRLGSRGVATGLCFDLLGTPTDTSRFVHARFEGMNRACGDGAVISGRQTHPVTVDRTAFVRNHPSAVAFRAPGSRLLRSVVDTTIQDHGIKLLGAGITVDSTAIRGSYWSGIYMYDAANARIRRSEISGNVGAGLYIRGSVSAGVVIDSSNIYANAQTGNVTGQGITAELYGDTIDARGNWWGRSSGPAPAPSAELYSMNGAPILAADSGHFRTSPTPYWPVTMPASIRFALNGVELAGDTIHVSSLQDTTALGVVIRDGANNPISGFPHFATGASTISGSAYFHYNDRRSLVTNGEGAVTVTVTYLGLVDTAIVAVRQRAAGIDIYPRVASIGTGGSFRFRAAAFDSNGYHIPRLRDSVTWSGANGATVDATGLATAAATQGTATLTATYGTVSGTRDWNVVASAPASCAVGGGTVLEGPGYYRSQPARYDVASSVTLPAGAGPYRFPHGIEVQPGRVATLEPGTLFCGRSYSTIRLASDGSVGGRLVAHGTAAAPILFRADSLASSLSYSWGGIVVDRDSSSFRHVKIEQADVPLRVEGYGQVAVDSSLLRTSGYQALLVYGRAHVTDTDLERPEGGYYYSPTGAQVSGTGSLLSLRGSTIRGMYRGIDAYGGSTVKLENDSILGTATAAMESYAASVHVDGLVVRGSGAVSGTVAALRFLDSATTLTFGAGGWSVTGNSTRPLQAPVNLLARIADVPARLAALTGNTNDQLVVQGGTLTADTLAVTATQPWHIGGEVSVGSGGLLRMEPGSRTTVVQHGGIRVLTGGQFRSVGTASSPVLLEGDAGYQFRGITFSGTQAAGDSNLIRHTVLRRVAYAYGDTSAAAILTLDGRTVTVDSSRIVGAYAGAIAIRAATATDSSVIRHVQVDSTGMGITVVDSRAVIVGSTVRKTNGRPGIGIHGSSGVRLTADTVIDAGGDGIYANGTGSVRLDGGHVSGSIRTGLRLFPSIALVAGSTGPRVTTSGLQPFAGSLEQLKRLYPTIADQETRLAGNTLMEVTILNGPTVAGTTYEIAPALAWNVVQPLNIAGEGTLLSAGAGTTIRFGNGAGLAFTGGARAAFAGSAAAPVQLRPALAGGSWAGIDFDGAPGATSTLTNVYVSGVANSTRAALNTSTTHPVAIDSLLMVRTGKDGMPTQAIALRSGGSSLRRSIVDTVANATGTAVSIETASATVDSLIVRRSAGYGVTWSVPGGLAVTGLSNLFLIENATGLMVGATQGPGSIAGGYFVGNGPGNAVSNNGGANPTLTVSNAWWGADAAPQVDVPNGISAGVEISGRKSSAPPPFTLFGGIAFQSVIAGTAPAPATSPAARAPAARAEAETTLRGGR